jgi:hypothetical protein
MNGSSSGLGVFVDPDKYFAVKLTNNGLYYVYASPRILGVETEYYNLEINTLTEWYVRK